MGLDSNIRKRPQQDYIDVKYWRKNWVLQNWIDTNHHDTKLINLKLMYDLLKYIQDEDNHQDSGSEGWTKEHWSNFEQDIKEIINDMKSNESYE